ncbi:MAG: hypothetical protein JNK23_18550 [Opitutaceae bacterium]|nr:hypothetical protein [Opitutaceae bacterium]
MITRPLNLGSRLRLEPRSLDGLFFVNVGLIGLFFALFGSRFVLAPGLAVDFRLPVVQGANTAARPPTHVISVVDSSQVFTSDGLRKISDLREWLVRQRSGMAAPLVLVRGSADVPISVLADISNAATAAGFEVLLAASEPAAGASQGGR